MKKYLSDKEALILVKERLLAKGQGYICTELSFLKLDNKISALQYKALTKWVTSMLAGYDTYGQWVQWECPLFQKMCLGNRNNSNRTYLPGRLAWLDWMIDHCEDWGTK